MQRLALILALVVGSASAQEPKTLTTDQEAFAREMILCGQKYVALKLHQPGSDSPMQIVTEGRRYSSAARAVAEDAFVDQETPAIRQSALEYVSKVSGGGKRATESAIEDVKRDCDGKLAAHTSSER